MICLTGSMFNMTALVLRQGGVSEEPEGVNEEGSENGRYEYVQDPISGSFERVWVPETGPVAPEDQKPFKFDPNKPMEGRRILCSARAIMEGGIRVTATTERYSTRGTLAIEDYINFEFPADEILTRRDRITDIRNSNGDLIWIEEESTSLPTVFEVTGVSPVTDPFGIPTKNFSLLERADDQASLWTELRKIGTP